jgi:hypothetical protein
MAHHTSLTYHNTLLVVLAVRSMMDDDDKLRVKLDPLGFLKDHDAIARVARSTQNTVSAVRHSTHSERILPACNCQQQQQQQQQQLVSWMHLYVLIVAASCGNRM